MTLLHLLRAENLSLRQALWLKAEEVDRLTERLAVAEAEAEAEAEAGVRTEAEAQSGGETGGRGETQAEGEVEAEGERRVGGEIVCERSADAYVGVNGDEGAEGRGAGRGDGYWYPNETGKWNGEWERDRCSRGDLGRTYVGVYGKRGLGLERKVERLEERTEGLERRVGDLCRRWVGEWEGWVGGAMGESGSEEGSQGGGSVGTGSASGGSGSDGSGNGRASWEGG